MEFHIGIMDQFIMGVGVSVNRCQSSCLRPVVRAQLNVITVYRASPVVTAQLNVIIFDF